MTRKHSTRVVPPSPAATANRPSVILPRRCQFSKGRCERIQTIQTATLTLGLLYAYMNRKEDAIREGRRAVELEPESKNAFHGAGWAANLALVYALVGEQDQAITLIERLLSTPGPVGAHGGRYLEHHTGRTASALGVGLAPQQSALPEDPRRPGAEDDLLGAMGEHTCAARGWISNEVLLALRSVAIGRRIAEKTFLSGNHPPGASD